MAFIRLLSSATLALSLLLFSASVSLAVPAPVRDVAAVGDQKRTTFAGMAIAADNNNNNLVLRNGDEIANTSSGFDITNPERKKKGKKGKPKHNKKGRKPQKKNQVAEAHPAPAAEPKTATDNTDLDSAAGDNSNSALTANIVDGDAGNLNSRDGAELADANEAEKKKSKLGKLWKFKKGNKGNKGKGNKGKGKGNKGKGKGNRGKGNRVAKVEKPTPPSDASSLGSDVADSSKSQGKSVPEADVGSSSDSVDGDANDVTSRDTAEVDDAEKSKKKAKSKKPTKTSKGKPQKKEASRVKNSSSPAPKTKKDSSGFDLTNPLEDLKGAADVSEIAEAATDVVPELAELFA